jgi:3',5'-cyclic AMP phosphodiesterase CpdA
MFVAMGDNRSSPSAYQAVCDRASAIDPEFFVHSGDLTTFGENASYWDPEFFAPMEELAARSCLFPSIGNHEGNGANYINYFYLPSAGSGSERYYSFDYANSHFIVLDTTIDFSDTSAQYGWLESDLSANESKLWIFVYFHHPPYSSGSHGSDLNVRNTLTPLFEQYGVDMVFSGHDHDYERGLVNGIYYIVTGGAGAPLRPVGTSWWTQYSASLFHCCKIFIDGHNLTFEVYMPDGTLLDSFSTSSGVQYWHLY